MKAPASFFIELMAKVRRDLYKGLPDKAWFSQMKMVKKALLYPARYLKKLGVEISSERYQAILEDIIDGIVKHGHLDTVDYMARYFYTSVQRHMDRHGDNYYREGKAIGNRITILMTAVERAQRGSDGTVETLAQVDALLQLGKRKPNAPKAKPDAPELPRKVRTDSLAVRLSAEQQDEIARRVASGTSYRQIIALCATWGINTSLGSLSEYLKPKAAPAPPEEFALFPTAPADNQ